MCLVSSLSCLSTQRSAVPSRCLLTQVLVDVMRKRTVKAGEWVIRQGDTGDCFFIIDKGTFEVRVNPDSNAVVTDEKDAGEFGYIRFCLVLFCSVFVLLFLPLHTTVVTTHAS